MKKNQFYTENYLEYRLEKADGNFIEDEVQIYFERDSGNTVLENKLFITLNEWKNLTKFYSTPSYDDKLNSLPLLNFAV